MSGRSRVEGGRTWRGLTLAGDRRPGSQSLACCQPHNEAMAETYGEDDGNASSNGFAARYIGLVTQPQVLRLAAVTLPAQDGSSKQEDLDAVARGQRRNHLLAAALSFNVDLSSGSRGCRRAYGRGAVCAVDHGHDVSRGYVWVASGNAGYLVSLVDSLGPAKPLYVNG